VHTRVGDGGHLAVTLPHGEGARGRSPLRDDPAFAAALFFVFAGIATTAVQCTPRPHGDVLAVWYSGDLDHGERVLVGLRRVLALIGHPWTEVPAVPPEAS
jgi:hypothetical protein